MESYRIEYFRTKKYMRPITNIQIEPLNWLCTRACEFCIVGKEKAHHKVEFLNLELLEKICIDLKSQEFAGQISFTPLGEFFCHPDWVDIIYRTRCTLPSSYIFLHTNGDLVDSDTIHKFFMCGGNSLIVSCYDLNTYQRILGLGIRVDNTYIYDTRGKYYSLDGQISKKYHYYQRASPRSRIIVLIKVFGAYDQGMRKFHSWLGKVACGSFFREAITKGCTMPFRWLVISPKGFIKLCCTGGNELALYKYPEEGSLKKLWNSEQFELYRSALRYGFNGLKRVLPLCDRCNSYCWVTRQGLCKANLWPEGLNIEDVVACVEAHRKTLFKKWEELNIREEERAK